MVPDSRPRNPQQPSLVDDGAVSYHTLPAQDQRMVHRMVAQAERQQRRQLMRGTLIALGCMLVVLIFVGVMFAR